MQVYNEYLSLQLEILKIDKDQKWKLFVFESEIENKLFKDTLYLVLFLGEDGHSI